MRISKPEILQHDGEAVYSVRVASSLGDKILWYRVDATHADFLTDRSDAPLLALLIPAMARGEEVRVEGTVSERLYHALSGPYQHILRSVIPSLRRVSLHAADLAPPGAPRAPGVATGFSAGIDSYCVLADYHYADAPAELKLTHLLFNNVGSHGEGGERLFQQRLARVDSVARRIGLPLIRVNSNLTEFYKPFSFQQTHTPRNASVPFLLQNGIGRYLYASAYAYGDAFVGPARDMAYCDAVALPLLSTDSLEAISVGGEYTRVEKTLRVADIVDSHSTLDVCVSFHGEGNCSACFKCLRTLLTLEIAGLLDRYADVFDLEEYRRRRTAYMATVLASRDPLQREIVRFARQRRYRFPISSRLLAGLYRPVQGAARAAAMAMCAAVRIKRSFAHEGGSN
jgi:hypothetical protein